jgi:hypothetical protein
MSKTMTFFQRVFGSGVAAWNQYWFAAIDPHGAALYRILMGVFLLCYILPLLPHVELLFSNQGVYYPLLHYDIAPVPWAAWIIYLVTIGVMILFTLGYRTSILTPLLLVLFGYHWILNLALKNTAYDRLILLLLLISCFAKLDAAWAISASKYTVSIMAWPVRLLCFQIAALYFGSGLWKLYSDAWHSGAMLEMTLIGPWGTPVGFWFVNLDWPNWIYHLLTWSTITFELTVGFGLYVPRVQRWCMLLGLLFHVSIWLFLSIPEFLVCVCVYPCFIAGEDVRRILKLVKRIEPALRTVARPRWASRNDHLLCTSLFW